MTYIYADVLLIVNLYVNWLMLSACAKITNTKVKALRILLASFFGALLSFSIFLKPFGIVFSVIYKLLGAFFMSVMAFGRKSPLKNCALLCICSFLFAGTALAFSILLPKANAAVLNGSVYFDISFAALLLFTCISYLIICAVKLCFDKSSYKSGVFRVMVKTQHRCVSLKGVADTGNMLVDSITAKPVVVCGKSDFDFDLEYAACEYAKKALPDGLRYVPYSTVSGSGALAIFKPESVEIYNEQSGKSKTVDVMVGLGENNGTAVFNPKLLM